MSILKSAPLKTFLASARRVLVGPARPLTLVVGNESADLDSLCSAVLYAYFRTNAIPNTIHIPLSNLPRADLALRPEIAAVLRYADLTPADLITLDDLPADLELSETSWVLVDHNQLTGPLAKFQSQVTGCIDHHVDEGKLPSGISPRFIDTCGSCCSMIVEECKKLWTEEMGVDPTRDTAIARLALAPVLIDTGNLLVADKTTPRDVLAAKFLSGKLGPGFVQTDYYNEIDGFKSDLSQMSLRDVLRKDYKEWMDGGIVLGTASSARGFDYLLVKAENKPDVLVEAVKDWSAEKKLDVVAVLTIISGEPFRRELMLWGISEKGVLVVKNFEAICGEKIGLQQWKEGVLDGDEAGYRRTWAQQNTTQSRKQIAPMLREIMQAMTDE
ncbi:hypothetical protein TD95_004142 [Thielaviopsis punctulata]|uniref:DHHA2 domain-containing protein n=1 Tax=Thielaviopsis punctulata TaxID=72032 RepID=A0A0F4ZGG7_9PEZI|nr:hypothetical protein TD95_004142 [Thielaviopsis punctulata]